MNSRVWQYRARPKLPREMQTGLPPRVEVVSSYLAQRLAHPPLGARASVERGVEVVIIIKAAEQGGSLRLDGASCSHFYFLASSPYHFQSSSEKPEPQ